VTDLAEAGVISRRIDRLLGATSHPEPVKLGGSPFAPFPPHMLEALRDLPERSTYGDSRGDPALRAAIGARLAAEGLPVDSDRVLVTNGATHALDVCFRTLLEPGDGVVMPRPGYFIDGLVRRAGGVIQPFASSEQHDWRPDWDAAQKAVTSSSRLLFLNTPVNPTGYVYTEDDLQSAWQLAGDHDLLIVSDESYSHFVYGGREHRSPLSLDPDGERTILVRSFSKDYAMPGWRLGYMTTAGAVGERLAATLEWSCLCVNQAAQAIGSAALEGPREWIGRFVGEAGRVGAAGAAAIAQIPGLRCLAPQGGLNILVGYPGDVDQLVRHGALNLGFAVQPGPAFGAPGYFRFQFGGSADSVETGLERLAVAVKALSNGGTGGLT
jgi:aspartate/methionine/tyrosine aminotransferase